MKPVKMITDSDCFRACVASILELPAVEVPDFCSMPGDWYFHLKEWCYEHELVIVEVDAQAKGPLDSGTFYACNQWCILSGVGPRSRRHSVVGWFDGTAEVTLEWDPHPSREFLGGNPPEWIMFMGRRPT